VNVRRLLPRDAIPSIDEPAFGAAYFGDPDDEVVVVEPESGPARAYPLRVLHYHEVINDVLGDDAVDGGPHEAGDRGTDGAVAAGGAGRAVAVTWCPICGSAVVYDRAVDGDVLEFGVSGKLADDDLVLYDRESGSEWKQSSGLAVSGPHEGRRLTVLPAGIVPYRRFEEAHPDGVVLDPAASDARVGDAGAARRYYDPEPYEAYFARGGFGYEAIKGRPSVRDWDRDDLPPKAPVLGLGEGDHAVGVPYPVVVESGGVVELDVDDRPVVVVATDDGFHAYEAPGFALEPTDDGRLVGDGTSWDPASGEGEDGRRLERVAARRLFAFAWRDDHGPDRFYEV